MLAFILKFRMHFCLLLILPSTAIKWFLKEQCHYFLPKHPLQNQTNFVSIHSSCSSHPSLPSPNRYKEYNNPPVSANMPLCVTTTATTEEAIGRTKTKSSFSYLQLQLNFSNTFSPFTLFFWDSTRRQCLRIQGSLLVEKQKTKQKRILRLKRKPKCG